MSDIYKYSKSGFDVYYNDETDEYSIWEGMHMTFVDLPDSSKQSVDKFFESLDLEVVVQDNKLIKQGAKATGEAWRDNYKTPQYILDAVNNMWSDSSGPYWQDPCPENHTVDILSNPQLWPAHAYVNPPFSQYSKFVELGASVHGKLSSVGFIWILDNGKTETKYGQTLLDLASAVCYLSKRVPFIDPRTDLPAKNNRAGQILIYWGTYSNSFCRCFEHLGVTRELL